ncbi:hypothetical protein BH09VER1_BH09VER1_48970 [soil metagenome]
MKKPRLLKYLSRYWILLVIVALAVGLALSNTLFQAVGTLIYLPVLVLGAAAVALLLRNVLHHETSDADADSGRFTSEWRALPAEARVKLSILQFLAYFIGACWIAAALIK